MNSEKTLRLFFTEKQLEHRTYAIVHNKQTHMVESEFLINVILNHTPQSEQDQIRETIVKIDFMNGDIHHYLEHLAKAYVLNNF